MSASSPDPFATPQTVDDEPEDLSIERQAFELKFAATRKTIGALAVLYAISGAVFAFLAPDTAEMIGQIVVHGVLVGIHVFLYFLSRRAPLAAVGTALAIFLGLQLLNLAIDPSSVASGLIMKVIIVVALVRGVREALELRRAQRILV